MTDNNIEKTIGRDETDIGANFSVSKYHSVYFKVSLDKKFECPYSCKDLTKFKNKNQ